MYLARVTPSYLESTSMMLAIHSCWGRTPRSGSRIPRYVENRGTWLSAGAESKTNVDGHVPEPERGPDMSTGEEWTCPALGQCAGQDATMSTRGTQKWTCPPGASR